MMLEPSAGALRAARWSYPTHGVMLLLAVYDWPALSLLVLMHLNSRSGAHVPGHQSLALK